MTNPQRSEFTERLTGILPQAMPEQFSSRSSRAPAIGDDCTRLENPHQRSALGHTDRGKHELDMTAERRKDS
jgi:hypothetical protein